MKNKYILKKSKEIRRLNEPDNFTESQNARNNLQVLCIEEKEKQLDVSHQGQKYLTYSFV